MTYQGPAPQDRSTRVLQIILPVAFAILALGMILLWFWPFSSGEIAGATRHQGLINAAREDLRAQQAIRRAWESLKRADDPKSPLPADAREASLKDAIAGFTEYLAYSPGYAPVLADRARCYELLGRLPEALADLEAAYKADPAVRDSLRPRIVKMTPR